MSAHAMTAGKLHDEPVTRPTRNGGQVTFFKLRVINGAELEFWDVATFSDTARAELEGVGEGDAVSAVGVLRVELFVERRTADQKEPHGRSHHGAQAHKGGEGQS